MDQQPSPLELITVVLFYNKPKLTLGCVTSIFDALETARSEPSSQLWRHKLILVDNGSAPSSRTEIETQALMGARQKNECIEFISIKPNQGFSKGMNAGLAAAFRPSSQAQRLVSSLSNDIEVSREYFVNLVEAAAPAGVNRILCPTVFHLKDRLSLSYTHGSFEPETKTLAHHKGMANQTITFPLYYPGAAMVWSEPAYEALGGFDERYFCYWEDVSLSFYATMKGVPLVPAPHLRVHHLGRGTTGGKSVYNRHFAEGRERFLQSLINP